MFRFSFCLVAHAQRYKTGSRGVAIFSTKRDCVVTIFDLQTCERRGQTTGCLPSFDQLKFLQLDKHKMQNLLNEKCFSDSKSPFCARNLEIYQNKPAIFAI